MELKFRTLKANEIECRVGQVKDNKGFTLLLYKDARVDMALLDEIVGKGKWQREHKILGNDIYCKVGIWNEELKQFVWYEDAGSSGTIEVEKSKASDSFKRACVNVGIGRELYTAPFIWVKTTEQNQPSNSCSYSVKEIAYNDKSEISKLVIINDKTFEVVYSYPRKENVAQNGGNQQNNAIGGVKQTIAKEDLDIIELYLSQCNEEKRKSLFAWLDGTFNTMTPANLSYEQGQEVAKKLKGRIFNGK